MATTTNMKPIKVWVSSSGPNPWKPVLILEELSLPYTLEKLTFDKLVSPEYRRVNPVGKVPAVEDPNTDVLIWESGAIILYLIEQYDTQHKLSHSTVQEKALSYQWLMYQMSGQGPFFGQAAWFTVLHPENVPSAIERYVKQVHIVLGTLDGALKGKTWLVGEKCTYVDLAFFPWNEIIPLALALPVGETPLSQYANVSAWHERMKQMESVKKVWATRQAQMDAENMGEDGLPKDRKIEDMVKSLDEASKT